MSRASLSGLSASSVSSARHQRELREKLRRVGVLPRVVGQDVEFLRAAPRSWETSFSRTRRTPPRSRSRWRCSARWACPPGAISSSVWTNCFHIFSLFAPTFTPAKRVAERIHRVAPGQRLVEVRPELVRRDAADARQQPHDALEGHLVAVVGGELQKRRHVLDVRLLEETQPARDLEGHPVAGQLESAVPSSGNARGRARRSR